MAITVPHTGWGFMENAAGASSIATGSGATNQAFSSSAGNMVLAFVAINGVASAVSSVTDSGGNSYSSVASVSLPSSAGTMALYKTTAASPAATTSVTFNANNSSSSLGIIAIEVAGANNTAGADGSAGTGVGTSTSLSSGSSGTPAGTADLVVGAGGNAASFGAPTLSGMAFTAGAGTNIVQALIYLSGGIATNLNATANYLVLSSAAAQTYTATVGSSAAWGGIVACFKPSTPSLPSRSVVRSQAVRRAAFY